MKNFLLTSQLHETQIGAMISILLLLVLLLTACVDNVNTQTPVVVTAPEGPALIMFFTDN